MKRLFILLFCILIAGILAGCSVEKKDEKKLKDLEITVMEKDEIPEEMKKMIEEQKKEPFQITYGDKEYLYIGQGYGEQPTSGYSITADTCYEAEDAIYIHTTLLGPGKDEEISENPTCPYVVVRTTWNEKHVVFQSK